MHTMQLIVCDKMLASSSKFIPFAVAILPILNLGLFRTIMFYVFPKHVVRIQVYLLKPYSGRAIWEM